jgi:GNAT superfamily N-acetyltransferase
MMKLRAALPDDKSAIIDLLRKSLGESTIPKSEILWNWKHEQNPFGPSYLLLAEEDDKLVGIRAFMRWEWRWRGQIYQAIRAVDTATDPAYQGRGIFKKLTLEQVAICKNEGISFVFNTPNNQSKPGYLKMGWVEQGKLPLKFKVLRPLSMAYLRIFKENKSVEIVDHLSPLPDWDVDIPKLVEKAVINNDHLSTHQSAEYISWRYDKNPLFRYHYFTDHTSFLIISRLKKHSFGCELRLVEFFLLDPKSDHRSLNKEAKRQVMEYCKIHKIDFVSVSGLQCSLYKDCFSWMGFIPVRAMGPSITLRDLNMNGKFPDLLEMKNWAYSLGDLELF